MEHTADKSYGEKKKLPPERVKVLKDIYGGHDGCETCLKKKREFVHFLAADLICDS